MRQRGRGGGFGVVVWVAGCFGRMDVIEMVAG